MTVKQFGQLNDVPGIEEYNGSIPIFASQKYADYLKKVKNYSTIWFYAKSDHNTRLLIPFNIRKNYIFKIGTFLTATLQLDNINDLKIEREFLNSITGIIKKNKLCDWIQQSPNWAIFNSYPDEAVFAPFGTYKIKLQGKSADELFNSIQTKDRSDIRKAIKEGVEVKSGFNLLNEALTLITATAEKAEISLPSNEELNFLKENIHVFISYYQTVPQSSAIFYANEYAWYNMYAGTKDHPFRGSNSLLYWSAIKSAKEKRVLFFDLVGAQINPEPGSKQEKIQRFKEHFGVELFKGYMWKMTISKYKHYMYYYLIKTLHIIKRKKFKGDLIDREINRQSIF